MTTMLITRAARTKVAISQCIAHMAGCWRPGTQLYSTVECNRFEIAKAVRFLSLIPTPDETAVWGSEFRSQRLPLCTNDDRPPARSDDDASRNSGKNG